MLFRSYGSAGAGGINHLMLELLNARTGAQIVHVPYRGTAPAVIDLVGGQIHLLTGTIPALLPHLRDAAGSLDRSVAFHNIDLPTAQYYLYLTGLFPLCRLEAEMDEAGNVLAIAATNSAIRSPASSRPMPRRIAPAPSAVLRLRRAALA